MKLHTRREFLQVAGSVTAGLGLSNQVLSKEKEKLFFKMSLGQWSLHRALRAKKLDNLDFPAKAKNDFGFSAVEYVNQFFMDKAKDVVFLKELKKRCDDNGVESVIILCDEEGDLGNPDKIRRLQSVENHYKWIDAAKYLGCASVRVNCGGTGSLEEVAKAAIEGLQKLSEYGKSTDMNILVENHDGYSGDAKWLVGVVKEVGMLNCRMLADFDNFNVDPKNNIWYDRYLGMEELMPLARGVSAKVIDFDENGNCVETDFTRMLTIVKKAGFRGYVGLEYEGNKLSEEDGIRAGKRLLEKVAAALS